MQFEIVHTVQYRYSRAVFLEPHEVRLQPRSCGYHVLRQFDLRVEPTPAGLAHGLDAEGNHVSSVWFDGEHEQLSVTVQSRVQTTRSNPFDYLLPRGGHPLPLQYDSITSRLIVAALQQEASGEETDGVAKFAKQHAEAAEGQLLPFLERLNQTIYRDFSCIRREEGDPWSGAQTLDQARGACRDLAVLFVEACRAVGVAARFVSGYQEGDTKQDQRDLHAWAEVFVPGGGWRGYDPTHGLAVADRHVAVAASADPRIASPLNGSFRGTGVSARMEADIELRMSSAE